MNIIKNSMTLAVVWAVSLTCSADDLTRRSDTTRIRGDIGKTDLTQVTIKRTNGDEISVPVNDLKTINFAGAPTELLQGQTNELSGAPQAALEKYQKAVSGTSGRMKSEFEFLIGRALATLSRVDASKAAEAKAALQKFRSGNQTHYRYLAATLLQASVQAGLDETEEATALLQEVIAGPVAAYKLQAGVDLGHLQLQTGDAGAALQKFDEVIQQSSAPEAAATKFAGMLGKAACQQKQSELDQAVVTLDEVIKNAPDTETGTHAEAWLRKGDCLRMKQAVKPALYAYLHVDVLYEGETAQHAEALARLVSLWQQAGHADRSASTSARLKQLYPNSQWAKNAGG